MNTHFMMHCCEIFKNWSRKMTSKYFAWNNLSDTNKLNAKIDEKESVKWVSERNRREKKTKKQMNEFYL